MCTIPVIIFLSEGRLDPIKHVLLKLLKSKSLSPHGWCSNSIYCPAALPLYHSTAAIVQLLVFRPLSALGRWEHFQGKTKMKSNIQPQNLEASQSTRTQTPFPAVFFNAVLLAGMAQGTGDKYKGGSDVIRNGNMSILRRDISPCMVNTGDLALAKAKIGSDFKQCFLGSQNGQYPLSFLANSCNCRPRADLSSSSASESRP